MPPLVVRDVCALYATSSVCQLALVPRFRELLYDANLVSNDSSASDALECECCIISASLLDPRVDEVAPNGELEACNHGGCRGPPRKCFKELDSMAQPLGLVVELGGIGVEMQDFKASHLSLSTVLRTV